MERVEHCELHPGGCMFSGNSGPVIDLGREIPQQWGRAYLAVEIAQEIGQAAGLPSPQAFAALVEANEQLEREVSQLENENVALRAALEEAESLRKAIAYTLARGVVTDPKKLTVGLRQVPGTTRLDVNRSLYEKFIVSVEGDPVAA